MVHSIKPLPYAYNALKGISEQVNKWHHDKHYAGYVNKRNEIEEKLLKADKSLAHANYSEFGELKRRETFNAAGQILHEIYYDIMGGDGAADNNLSVVQQIIKDFGSVENWRNDFVASGKTALGWAILCFDYSDGKLHNFVADSHNDGAVWGSVPLIPMDVFEHAYYFDQGPERVKYIEAFLQNLNWKKINEIFEQKVKK